MRPKLTRIFVLLIAIVVIGLVSSENVKAALGDLNWSVKTSLPTPRSGVALAAGLNGKLYAIGGSESGRKDVLEYSPQNNTWTSRAQVPISRLFSAAATGSDGKIYVIGGLDTNTVQAYNPLNNTWVTRASLPHIIYNLGAVAASNGKIYAVGGSCPDCQTPGPTYEYDISANTWTEKSPMLTPTFSLGLAATNNGKIYAISGSGGGDAGSLQLVQEYDITTDTWSRKADMPTARYILGAATLDNGKIYAVGGRKTVLPDGTPVEFATAESYDPATDTWASENPMSSVRGGLGVATLGGTLYAVGGFDCHFTSSCDDLGVVEAARIEAPNQAPSVDAGGSYSVNEGSFVTVSANGNDPENDPLTYAWDLDNNGSFETSGQNVTFSAANLDGPSTQTIAVRVTDSGNLTAIDTTTVNVSNVGIAVDAVTLTPSTIGMTGATTALANFSDAGVFDTHTATWDWGDGNITSGTVTESNGFGSVSDSYTYPNPGSYTVTLTVTDGQGGSGYNFVVLTVVKQITALSPAKVWIGRTAGNPGLKFDLLAEVFQNGTLVSSGQLNSVSSGGVNFNNANLQTISFDSFSPVNFLAGSSLELKLSVRNACTGSTTNSGKARLWYNDASANSQFGATVGTISNNYFLGSGLNLLTAPGTGPRQMSDLESGAQCSAFKSFGTWIITP
jgi:N-acetylneuraminic acid mutarotase